MSNFSLYSWEEQQLIDNKPSGALTAVHPEQSLVRLVPAQQLPDFLAPEQFFQSHDMHESIYFCAEHFTYTQRETAVAQVNMDEELSLSTNEQQYHITEKAHSDLCNMLGIPITFSYDIPVDLNPIIVQRLKLLHAQSVIVVARGDTIVSLVDPLKGARGRGKAAGARLKKKPHYMPLANLTLLHMLEKVCSGADVDTRITLSDRGMQVEILHKEESFTIEPVVGDVTRVGLAVTNSETGGALPLATGYTLRLVCTNGSTIKQNFGLARFSSDWRCTMERRLDRFTAELQSLSQDVKDKCGQLHEAYKRMAHEYLDDEDFYSLYRQAQYLSRGVTNISEHIDGIFGVEPGQRQEIIGRVRQRQRERQAANIAAIEPPQSTSLLAWDVFNGITAAARDEVRYHRVRVHWG